MSDTRCSTRDSHIQGDSRAKEHQKGYSPPSTGILSYFPASWVPYGELARIDKPTGIYLFFLPHLFGVLYAACFSKRATSSSQPVFDEEPSSTELLIRASQTTVILLAGTALFRASACSWNDTLDREYDRLIARCRLRPVARGAVSPMQAHILTGVTAVMAFCCLVTLPPICWIIALPSIFLLWLYPFAKRFTDFPQVILGFQVAIGFLIGVGAQNDDLVTDAVLLHDTSYCLNSNVLLSVLAFYLANVCWTVIYDTIYAQQDVKDDMKAGVRSVAVRFYGRAKMLLWTVAVAQVSLLVASGYWAGFGPMYMTLACGGTAVSLAYMLATVDLTNAAECAWWFRNGCWLVGASVAGGLAAEGLDLF